MKKKCVLISMILVVLLAHTCWAGTASDDMTVGVNVVTTCSVTANDLTFPDYDGSAAVTAQTTLDLNCSASLPVTIDFDFANHDGNFAYLIRAVGAPVLPYYLYSDPTYQTIWGTATTNGETVSYTGTGSSESLTVYGKINAGFSVLAATYTSTVTAELTW